MPRSPLIIVGLDVGDPETLTRWAAEGHLPTLGALIERGRVGRMTGPEMTCEHAVWTTVFSGLSLGVHGYYYYRRLKPHTYELQPITGVDIGARPFWSAFADGSRRCAILDAPDVLPLAGIDGVQLSDWAIHNAPFPPATLPASLMAEVRKAGGEWTPIDEALESDIRHRPQALPAADGSREPQGRRVSRDDGARALRSGGRGLLRLPHGDASVLEIPARGRRRGDGSATCHAQHLPGDRRRDRLASRDGASDAHIVIVGSTGMLDLYPAGDLMEPLCRLLEYQASPAPAAPSMHPLAIARRLVPERVRVAISRHFPRHVRERLLSDQFRAATDWSRTNAFALPSAYTGFIRVNLRGRDPQGIVAPGRDYDELLDRLESDVWKLTDPESGACPVASITRTARVFPSPSPLLPDLMIEWKPSRRFMDRLLHPAGDLHQQKPEFFRDSDHSRVGFVAAAGPSIGRGPLEDISPLDLAPTFLALLGERPTPEMTGRVIPELATSAVMA